MNKIADLATNTLATSILLCLSLTAQAQYNPNIQQNYQGGLNPLDFQASAAGAAAAASAAASSGMNTANNAANSAVNNAAASYQQNASAQFLQSSAPASTFGQAGTGYTNDGTLMMGGNKIGNPHQILHDAENSSLFGITAVRYTYTNDPTHGQGTLAQMEAATTAGSGADMLLNRLYLTPNNPYVGQTGSPYPNLATYAAVLKDAQKTNYLPTAADDGKIYVFKTLSTASTQSQNILIKELPNTSTFKAAADPLGGGVGVRVTQNGDAVALQNYLATVKPYDFSWQSAFGPYAAIANYGGPVVFGANGNVNGINPYVDPASFYFNWVMGSDQVQGFQTQLNNESKQSGNESFGQLAWDSNTNQYVMLRDPNAVGTPDSVTGTYPQLGAGQTNVFGMHTHPEGGQPSNQDLRQAAASGTDQVILGGNGVNFVVVPGSGASGGYINGSACITYGSNSAACRQDKADRLKFHFEGLYFHHVQTTLVGALKAGLSYEAAEERARSSAGTDFEPGGQGKDAASANKHGMIGKVPDGVDSDGKIKYRNQSQEEYEAAIQILLGELDLDHLIHLAQDLLFKEHKDHVWDGIMNLEFIPHFLKDLFISTELRAQMEEVARMYLAAYETAINAIPPEPEYDMDGIVVTTDNRDYSGNPLGLSTDKDDDATNSIGGLW